MQRTVKLNLDARMDSKTVVLPSGEPVSPSTPSSVGAGMTSIMHPYSIAAMLETTCVANLDNIGFRLKTHSSGANFD